MPSIRPRSSSPADRIVGALLRDGPLTIAELVSRIGVTTTAVSCQVNRLVREGVLTRQTRYHTGRHGRPAAVFAVREDARARLARGNFDLSRSLMEEIFALEDRRDARRILGSVARRAAERLKPELGAGSLAERLERFAQLGGGQAAGLDVEQAPAHVQLHVHVCPYAGLADRHRDICEMEEQTLSQALDTPVRLQQCMLDGRRCCTFVVSATP